MTDISKCFNGCDKRKQCYRWTAPHGYRQSYSDFKPGEDGNCEHFWDNREERK
jgi:hypothetical protein